MKKHRVIAALLATSLSLGGAACGDDDGAGTNGGSGSGSGSGSTTDSTEK